MAFITAINTGSRRDNPYSSSRSSSGGGLSLRIYHMLSPKIWAAFAILILMWFMTIILVVNENPDMKKEVFDDIHREEKLIKGKIQRGRLRAKEWLKKRLDLDPSVEAPASSSEDKKHEWDLTQIEDLALRTGPNDTPIHIVFSTDCTPYQHWQTYQFFLSALRIRQPGRVTQIASGCSESEAKSLKEWHAEHITPLSLRFGLHLTPHFSNVKDSSGNIIKDASGKAVNYEFFNKPFGLRHWLIEGEGMGIDPVTHLPWKHDTIIALLDPDQLLLRPITGYFESPNDIFRGGGSSGQNVEMTVTMNEKESQFMVRHGHPASQEYGYSDAWRKYAHVAGDSSPATKATSTDALRYYTVGPPYVATALDTYKIALKWTEFVPLVHHEFPQLMAEMYAYSIATAHLGLKHQMIASLMVSDTSVGNESGGDGEGWGLVDNIPGEEVCSFAMNSLDSDVHTLPSVIHFCQRYGVGDRAFFAKHKLPKEFFSCDSPLLEEPTMDIGSGKYLYRKPPFVDKKVEYSALVEKREAFMICAVTGFLNEASLFYKSRHCGDDANLKKEISLHDLPE